MARPIGRGPERGPGWPDAARAVRIAGVGSPHPGTPRRAAWWSDYVAHPKHGPLPVLLIADRIDRPRGRGQHPRRPRPDHHRADQTLTAIAADVRRRDFRVAARRVAAVAAMLLGAGAGTLLVLGATALTAGCALVAAVAVTAALVSRRPAPWHRP